MNPEKLYKLAMSLFEERHTDEAVMTLEKAANEGHPESQFLLGNLINENKITRPIEDMVMWYTKAADQNHLYAINNLAICYQQGYGVKRDFFKAFELLQKAYLLGDKMAGFNIGQAYWFGLGIPKDINKGFEYVKEAAQNNCPNAQYMMGQIFENGINDQGLIIDADINEAINWYEEAANNGERNAIDALERIGEVHDETEYPIIKVLPQNNIVVRADVVFPDKYDESNGEYIQADNAVPALYLRAKTENDPQALNILTELSGNYMNKYAFNALNHLGKIADITDDDTKQGFAQYMFDAWKSFDREKLEILAFWSFPSFEYSEYDSTNRQLLKLTNEKEFVDHLINEMRTARQNGKQIKMRLNMIGDEYVTDIMVGNKISTFRFLFTEKTFIGIERHFQA